MRILEYNRPIKRFFVILILMYYGFESLFESGKCYEKIKTNSIYCRISS